ncbi:MAG: hypothetical protein C0599_16690 [Salinivirgaceae bacterium]|nr:MAG: hypothetical protein C0599_16690 [Salinivirgaceae bacterium]
MQEFNIHRILYTKSNWLFHLAYWLTAGILIYYVFSSNDIAMQLRLPMVIMLTFFGFGTAQAINKIIIPKFLFRGKTFLSAYLILATFILALWISFISLFGIIYYSAIYSPLVVVPQWKDIVIMIAGNFLIITLAVVLHFIRESFRQMAAKNEILTQKAEAEAKLKDAQLKLLQGQIHPHFLFNMLNNLYALIRIDADLSRDTIMRISDLLDYMLYKCNEEQTLLESELKFIQDYIELERIRHSGNFNINVDYPQHLQNITIAPLILFPFVENAFKHGFRNSDNGYIDISISISEENIIFTCENSVAKSKTSQDKYLQQEGKGIGLKNIQERLEIIYKNNHSLNIKETGEKYKVELTLNRKK